jgi:hypothetical protein
MNLFFIIGVSILLFYIFNEFLTHNNFDPMDFSIVYIIYILFVGLAFVLPTKIDKLVSFK